MREKELRLALVCYGGISLAVYMHGITKEIWHMVRASRALHADEAPDGGTESVYATLLADMAAEGDVGVRVLADIVAGASAGGINGIFLARAIATGQSLEPLTDLWLASADVEALIAPSAAPSSRFSKIWAMPVAWMAAGRSAQDVETLDDATREEVRTKLSHFVRSRWFEPPFSGPVFTGLLIDALEAMAASGNGPRLLPPDQPLDLYVTVTDFTGHPERLALNSPPEVLETEHRLVIGFTDRRGEGLGDMADLAFAARATSSFPGAFPPFTAPELNDVLAARSLDWPTREAFLRRTLPRQHAAGQVDRTVLIDGSVLANAPFAPAIDALKERPARREIDRRFVYIDPKPGIRLTLTRGDETPGFFQTILGSLSDLPRQQPIRDNLDAIAERSRRIDRMRGIVAALRPGVEDQVERLFGHTLFLGSPTAARLAAWRRRAQAAAAEDAGYGYSAYGLLKLDGVVETIATLLAQIGGEQGAEARHRLRSALGHALRDRGIGNADVAFHGKQAAATIDFLRTFDLGFRIRRLRLLARRLGEIEAERGDTDGAALAAMRRAIYDSLAAYLDRESVSAHAALRPMVGSARSEAGALLDAFAGSLGLAEIDTGTDARLAEALALLDKASRRRLLLAYLGFPYFDAATLPLLQGEGLDEFDPIKVDRIAPDDARSLRAGGAEATLKGIQFNSFGAFFSRAYRENDYLWGRLHGAERMIDITVSTLPPGNRLKPGRVAAIKRAAFLAILAEEEARLTAIPALFAELRREIG